MTSVPKPLKFLRPHYPDLQILYESWPSSEDKVGNALFFVSDRKLIHLQSLFADILSVLAMTYSDTQPRGTLRYRLLSASSRPSDSPLADPGSWGHEYVRHLAAELGEEFTAREEESLVQDKEIETAETPKTQLPGTIDDLRDLARQCAKFLLSHNAEPDAVDLLEEMEIIADIANLVDENTYGRVCQYMIRYVSRQHSVPCILIEIFRCVNLLPPPDDVSFLRTAHAIYVKYHKFPEALSLAIRLGDPDLIRDDFSAPANP